VKNIGSLKDLEKAINYEIIRQKRILETGGKVVRETRHWDDIRGVTVSARHKEFEEEYKYMPEPDIPPLEIDHSYVREDKIFDARASMGYEREIYKTIRPHRL
jgi:aspartyl-tRNA(Asn)/glutamyl-tRNA(Gln) amidotransferase subunit B